MKRQVAGITIAMACLVLQPKSTQLVSATNESPSIGSARIAKDGTLWLKLRAQSEDNARGDALIPYPTNHPEYTSVLRHIGGIKPGQEKPVPPWPEQEDSPHKAPVQKPDPIDGFAQARDIPVNQEVEVRFSPRQQQDWLKLRIETRGTLKILHDWKAMRKSNLPFIPAATVYGPDRKQIGRLDPIPRLESSTGHLAVSPGTFYVMVQNQIQPVVIAGSAGVTFQFTPEEDPTEPNDDFDHARPADLNTEIPITLYPSGDEDYCVSDIKSRGFLNVTFKGQAGMKEAFVYDAKRARIGSFSEMQPWPRDAVRVTPGKVYVAFRSPGLLGDVKAAFHATIEFKPDADTGEPNDDFEHAQDIDPGAVAQFTLHPQDDKDFFMVKIPSPGHLAVVIGEGDGRILIPDPMATVYDESRKEIAELYPLHGLGPPSENGLRVRPGPLYIALSAREKLPFLPEPKPITARFQFTPDDDAMEPNDSFTQARDAKPSSPLRVVLWPPGDQDYFRIPVRAAATLYVTMPPAPDATVENVTLPLGPRPRIKLYDEKQRPIHGDFPRLIAPVAPPLVYLMFEQPKTWGPAGEQQRPVVLNVNLDLVADEDPTEPNDDFEHAVAAHLGKPIEVVFGSPADHDFLLLQVPSPGVIRATTLDETGRERKRSDDLGPTKFYDKDHRVLEQAVRSDRQVRAGSGPLLADIHAPRPDQSQQRGGIRRNVLFTFHPETDPTEPENDTRAGARPIQFGQPFTFQLMPDFDDDWFSFQLEAPDQLRWLTSGLPKSASLRAELHDQNGRPIGNLCDGPLVLSAPGTYAIRVRGVSMPGGPPVPLTAVLATDKSWRDANNTSPERAASLRMDHSVILPASTMNTKYYFMLQLHNASHVTLKTSWPEGSGELQILLGDALPMRPDAILRLAGGNHLLATSVKGQGVATFRIENMEHHLPPELQYLLSKKADARTTQKPEPAPPPRLVTRNWIFDVRQENVAP